MSTPIRKPSQVDSLVDFIENHMRMSHIYQPLLIRLLVESGGASTVRDLALRFVTYDEAELREMEGILKKMPVPVLKKHGFVDRSGELVSLNVKVSDLKDKARILRACETRLADYLEKKGENIWSYKWIANPVRNSIRYKVLADGNHRCALCGVSVQDRPLDVDHIIPKSLGGKSTYENLQVLCSKCNRSKGNKDNRDFRLVSEPSINYGDCVFCNREGYAEFPSELKNAKVVEDKYPVSRYHLLIVPNRHVQKYDDLNEIEILEIHKLAKVSQRWIKSQDKTVTGFNLGFNLGADAGQTIPHVHFHIIPRRQGDVENPLGGIRGVIPSKKKY
jgi:diadenosine tetraphosphate (Ap4A) HIT family hydrolase